MNQRILDVWQQARHEDLWYQPDPERPTAPPQPDPWHEASAAWLEDQTSLTAEQEASLVVLEEQAHREEHCP
jgi:hypothetical protein